MSKAAKQSILILIVLLIGTFALAAITLTDKQKLEREKAALEQQIEGFQSREKTYILENNDLKGKLAAIEETKIKMDERMKTIDEDMANYDKQIKDLTKDRDEWKGRVETLRTERESLLAKLKEKPKPEIIYKYMEPREDPKAEPEPQVVEQEPESAPTRVETVYKGDDSYWAAVLKEKATLEVKVNELKEKMSKTSFELAELKKQNSDLQLELTQLQREKENIERNIKHSSDLADTLSLQLARAKNDTKFMSGKVDELNDENLTLRDQIKKLTSTKIALEKSIIRIQDEKRATEQQLAAKETALQQRVEDIWTIKESLDRNIPPMQASSAKSDKEIELPPIVVSATGAGGNDSWSPDGPSSSSSSFEKTGFSGNVVSVNSENNFVIVDIGEGSGLRLGDALSVYRGSDYIGALEVIQVRKDIAAADIKNKVAKIQIGDTVR